MHEIVQQVHHGVRADRAGGVVRAHRDRVVESERPGEHREAGPQHTAGLTAQLVTPGDAVPQRLVVVLDAPSAPVEQRELIIDTGNDIRQ